MKPIFCLTKKSFFIYVFAIAAFNSLVVKSQVRPLYFYNDKQVVNKNKANSYAITGKLTNENIWMFKRYDLDNNLIETGSYKDEALTIPHGKFVYYMDIGYFNSSRRTSFPTEAGRFKANESEYVNGMLQGQRRSYYPTGLVMELETFKDDVLNGPYQSFDKKGQVFSQGNFVDGKREGEWIMNYGRKKYVYQNDKIVSKK